LDGARGGRVGVVASPSGESVVVNLTVDGGVFAPYEFKRVVFDGVDADMASRPGLRPEFYIDVEGGRSDFDVVAVYSLSGWWIIHDYGGVLGAGVRTLMGSGFRVVLTGDGVATISIGDETFVVRGVRSLRVADPVGVRVTGYFR